MFSREFPRQSSSVTTIIYWLMLKKILWKEKEKLNLFSGCDGISRTPVECFATLSNEKLPHSARMGKWQRYIQCHSEKRILIPAGTMRSSRETLIPPKLLLGELDLLSVRCCFPGCEKRWNVRRRVKDGEAPFHATL